MFADPGGIKELGTFKAAPRVGLKTSKYEVERESILCAGIILFQPPHNFLKDHPQEKTNFQKVNL
jgi:hypothetical protein